ncbi:MAG: hypothetical protein D6689_19040 [Deltaproteobacteria bacterium]|nr:MAG: hypothetical protein D6689_19040 [Deltaproteobacteria bacterium]
MTLPSAQTLPPRRSGALVAFGIGGAIVAAIAVLANPAAGWAGVLTAAVYGLTIALGGALFAAIFAGTGAVWWLPIRSIPLAIAGTLLVPALALALFVALGAIHVYPWADPEVVAHNHLIHGKAGWLNWPFYAVRAAVVLLLWWALVGAMRRRFAEGRPLARIGIGFLVVFALTLSVASWDWLMSIETEWYSTMYAVYVFAGAIHAGIATTALVTFRRRRALGAALDRNRIQTLGSLLFAFAFFWGYIWFSQAMLIWYANIPEETIHYAARMSNGWTAAFWLNLVLNLAVPFLVLMPVGSRRSTFVVSQVAVVVLLGHWLDVLLLVGPGVAPASSAVPYAAVGATVAVGAAMLHRLRRDRLLAPQ